MPGKSVARKLGIKAGMKVCIVNAPRGYKSILGPLPGNVIILKSSGGPADVIQIFVNSRKDLEAHLGKMKSALASPGMLWVTYHKGTSKIATDINRDSIASYAATVGLHPVAIISVDDDWSALRLKVD